MFVCFPNVKKNALITFTFWMEVTLNEGKNTNVNCSIDKINNKFLTYN